MLKAVLFDLDGTLIPMDQDVFVKAYFKTLHNKVAHLGYELEPMCTALWAGTKAMATHDGTRPNSEIFWERFSKDMGADVMDHMDLFEEFYRVDFNKAKEVCGFNPDAQNIVREARNMGLRTILATNPFFPISGMSTRIRWTGLEPEDFELITHYENSHFCKPNPKYFIEILEKTGLKPEECLMIGNDVSEDTCCLAAGIELFLVTDCLINKTGEDISQYPHGTLADGLEYIKSKIKEQGNE